MYLCTSDLAFATRRSINRPRSPAAAGVCKVASSTRPRPRRLAIQSCTTLSRRTSNSSTSASSSASTSGTRSRAWRTGRTASVVLGLRRACREQTSPSAARCARSLRATVRSSAGAWRGLWCIVTKAESTVDDQKLYGIRNFSRVCSSIASSTYALKCIYVYHFINSFHASKMR